jgi:hypothetical protein
MFSKSQLGLSVAKPDFGGRSQGDQLGKFSPIWRLFTLDNFFSPLKVMYYLVLTKNGLGYILGDLLTNQSGHPGHAAS